MNRIILFLRGAIPLLLVALALVGLPTLLAWWLIGGSWRWWYLLVGLLAGGALFGVGGMIFGWAIGRGLKRK